MWNKRREEEPSKSFTPPAPSGSPRGQCARPGAATPWK